MSSSSPSKWISFNNDDSFDTFSCISFPTDEDNYSPIPLKNTVEGKVNNMACARKTSTSPNSNHIDEKLPAGQTTNGVLPTVSNNMQPIVPMSQQQNSYIPNAIMMLADKPAKKLDSNDKPNDNDILFGKRKHAFTYPGNIRLRSIAATFATEYETAKTRFEKTLILDNIIEKLSSPDAAAKDNDNDKRSVGGRFLQYDTKEQSWYEMSTNNARLKVGKTLRDIIASRKTL